MARKKKTKVDKLLKQDKEDINSKDLEDLLHELVLNLLSGFEVKTQEDYESKETKILDELENIKDDLEALVLSAVEELPADNSELDFEDEKEDAEFEDLEDEL